MFSITAIYGGLPHIQDIAEHINQVTLQWRTVTPLPLHWMPGDPQELVKLHPDDKQNPIWNGKGI